MDTILGILPRPLVYTTAPFVISGFVLVVVRVYTTLAYYQSLRQFDDSPKAGKHNVTPPQIPYSTPWLGNSTSFLSNKPGDFWRQLFFWYPRSTGVCTLLLAGRKTHILFSPTAVQAMFKARSPSRDVFEKELMSSVFQLPNDQIKNAYDGKHHEHEMSG